MVAKFKLLEMDPEFEKDEEEAAKRGRPPFVPTDEQRELVKQMAIAGIDPSSMAIMIRWPDSDKPISRKTLYEKFPDELVQGVVHTNIRVAAASTRWSWPATWLRRSSG